MIDEIQLPKTNEEINSLHRKANDMINENPFLIFRDKVPEKLLVVLYQLFSDETFENAAQSCVELLIYYIQQKENKGPKYFLDLFCNQESSNEFRITSLLIFKIIIKNMQEDQMIPKDTVDILFDYLPNKHVISVISCLIKKDYEWAYKFMYKIIGNNETSKIAIINDFFIDFMHKEFIGALKLIRNILRYKEYLAFFKDAFNEILNVIKSCQVIHKINCYKTLQVFLDSDDLYYQLLITHENISFLFLPILGRFETDLMESALKFVNVIIQMQYKELLHFFNETNFFEFIKQYLSLPSEIMNSNSICIELICQILKRFVRVEKFNAVSILIENQSLKVLYSIKQYSSFKTFQLIMSLIVLCINYSNNEQVIHILQFANLADIGRYADSINGKTASPFLDKISESILNYEKYGEKYIIDEKTIHELKELSELEDEEDNKITLFLHSIDCLFE